MDGRSLAACDLGLGICGKLVVPQTDGVTDSESGNPACSKHHRGRTMDYYAGIDVSLEQSSICVLDSSGKVIREAKVASEPGALIAWFANLGLPMTAFPKRSPSPGTRTRSDRTHPCGSIQRPRVVDRYDPSFTNPIWWRSGAYGRPRRPRTEASARRKDVAERGCPRPTRYRRVGYAG